MQHRFRFLSTSKVSEKEWLVEGDELFHLRKVLRLTVGTEIEVFNNEGIWGIGVLKSIDTRAAVAELSQLNTEAIKEPCFALAIGALQAQTMADLIPSLVELGVDELHVYLPEGTAKTRLNEKTVARWSKIALSALKQCKRTRMPLIQEWGSLEECLKAASLKFSTLCFLDAEAAKPLLEFELQKAKPLCFFLGSEKGFSASELALLQKSGVQTAHLGTSILRAFTAAIATASLISSKRDSI